MVTVTCSWWYCKGTTEIKRPHSNPPPVPYEDCFNHSSLTHTRDETARHSHTLSWDIPCTWAANVCITFIRLCQSMFFALIHCRHLSAYARWWPDKTLWPCPSGTMFQAGTANRNLRTQFQTPQFYAFYALGVLFSVIGDHDEASRRLCSWPFDVTRDCHGHGHGHGHCRTHVPLRLKVSVSFL